MKIPDELKADLPPSLWGKLLGATPIVMTVVATILAGLASSEMTSAQYDRVLAAQLQSKAGDQWGLFLLSTTSKPSATTALGQRDSPGKRGVTTISTYPGTDRYP